MMYNSHYSAKFQTNLEINQFYTRTESLKNEIFTYCIKEWNNYIYNLYRIF